MDGGTLEIPREEALEFLPYRSVMVSPLLKSPIEALFTYRGKILPLLGPLPAEDDNQLPLETRPWVLVLKGCAQVVRGLPEFEESIASRPADPETPTENDGLLQELDQLLKSA